MTPISEFADQYVKYRKNTEHEAALWSGELTHLESWNDVSLDGLEQRRRTLDEMASRAAELTLAAHDDDPRTQRLVQTIEFGARSAPLVETWREQLRWVNHTMGIVPMVLTFLPRYPLVTAEDGSRYLEKLHRLPGFFDEWRHRLEEGAAEGVVPIRHHVIELIRLIDGVLTGQMSASALAHQKPPTDLSPAAAAAWLEQVLLILDTSVAPAMRRVRDTLHEHTLPAARSNDTPGLCHLPDGEAIYEQMLWASTTTDHSAAEVHQIGLDHVALLEGEYRQIGASAVGVNDVPTLFDRLRDDPELHYQSAEALVADARAALDRATTAAEGWFGRLPVTPCEATSINQGPLAFYSKPLPDGTKNGIFFFNTAVPQMWGTFQIEATTFHEGIPGHHLQLALAVEDEHLHDVHTEFGIAAYNEGWGLYTERLADEMGLYTTELDRLGMLTADSMRACRLVVDTGIHAMGWTRDQAIAFMSDNSPMSITQVEGEIDRYIGLPGQATSYMMGRQEIDAIREEAALRPFFDLAAFHDTVLGCGAVPLAVLRTAVLGD